jgi:hypothetical protein
MSLHGIDGPVTDFEIECPPHWDLFDHLKRAPELRTFPARPEGGRFLVLVE